MAWGGEGYNFTGKVLQVTDPNFTLKKITFDTHSIPAFQELENVAGKKNYFWAYGSPTDSSDFYTRTYDIYKFELLCEDIPELSDKPKETLRYERMYIYEPARKMYWRIKAAKRLLKD